ncbi:MAG: CapA family protein [Spirochaetota bacterium]|nr:MAG: CapA family protein [Spirochaetota bacterium]
MKRLYLIIVLIVGAFVFFSFLSKTDQRKASSLIVFFDKDFTEESIVVREVVERFEQEELSVSLYYFDPADVTAYIMSHPDALFITDKKLKSDLYSLTRFDLFFVKVAVVDDDSKHNRITGSQFDRVACKDSNSYYKIISYQDLTIDQRLLSVDDIFPNLHNVKHGIYPKVYKAHIYTKDNDILEKERYSKLRYHLGGWIDQTFSMIAGGDIMLARGTRKYMDKLGYRYPFNEIAHEIERCDIAVANLESPISSRGKPFTPFKGIYFRANPEVIDGLKFSGFDIFSLANNHAFDWGVDAISDTMTLLDENGMKYCGVGRTRKEALSPAVVRINGTKIAFISYNDIYPFVVKDSDQTMLTLTLKSDSLRNEIGSLKKKYDVVIASVHSGIEYLRHPEQEKVVLMRSLRDYGVDVVLGSHPHVIQDIEVYRGGIIAYSLGNLIFDQNWSRETSLGLLLEIAFVDEHPIYYYPYIIDIRRAQARVLENINLESILISSDFERREYAYQKN